MLIVFSGLPGTGKTTLANALAKASSALYLRIDSIEQAIRDAAVLVEDVGTSGYRVAGALALANLRLGHRLVVDCVNPVAESRRAWAEIAEQAGVALVDIQVICSDPREHRRRVESRQADIPGLTPPDWQSVLNHDYQPWTEPPFTVDSARLGVPEAVEAILARLAAASVA
ncbi:AAA family ATPase [Pseudomonas japonica]|uniref:AAA family ATPase n=1 Tax=Pseudomonas japonica TaxID=256466 RepID=UPI00381CE402